MNQLSLSCVLFTGFILASAAAQEPETKAIGSYERGLLHDIFHQTVREVKANYYDPTFHGLDVDGNASKYDALIDKVTTQGEGFRVIAGFLSDFHDSHLFFIPPPRPYRYDNGYRAQIIGDNEYIIHVRPGSDAAEKLSPGDRVIHFNGYLVTRASEHSMMAYYTLLAPALASRLDLSSPEGKASQVVVQSKLVPRKMIVHLASDDVYQNIRDQEGDAHRERDRSVEVDDVFIWKIAGFGANDIDGMMRRAEHHKTLILDLRGNPGGSIETLKTVVGRFFDHDVKLFDEVARKSTKPIIAKGTRDHAFNGKLIVLIDSHSASCSELAARVLQLEHRATIVGDLSAGAVMESLRYGEVIGGDVKTFYGLSITHANVLMSDGKSLEKVGVMPDERLLPTAEDIATGRDPVLSHAIELGGSTRLDPAAAGKLFPFEWPAF